MNIVDTNNINTRDPRYQLAQLKAARAPYGDKRVNEQSAQKQVTQNFTANEMGRRFGQAQIGLREEAFSKNLARRKEQLGLQREAFNLDTRRFNELEKPGYELWRKQQKWGRDEDQATLKFARSEGRNELIGGLISTGFEWIQGRSRAADQAKETEQRNKLMKIMAEAYGGTI
jgi:hypothetical protein